MRRQVVLVPGLGLFGLELLVLTWRLSRAGYSVHIFYYWAWNRSLSECTSRLRKYLTSTALGSVDFVAHSLGGLVVAQLCASSAMTESCRVVTLGTPHLGSEAARRFSKIPGGGWLLGRALRSALASVPIAIRGTAELGTIAGSLDTGLGWLLRLRRSNDSLVYVEEAHHPDALDNVTLRVSHSTMLISKRVAQEVACFLEHGRFCGGR